MAQDSRNEGLEVRLLGPLEVVVGGRPLDIGGPRMRIVLGTLALNANRVTPREHLVDAVWDDEPPATARAQIHICISRLRKLLDEAGHGEVITTRAPGYLLEIADTVLDVAAFDALTGAARERADEGRLPDAAAELRAALALWRGQPLADVPGAMMRREAALLEERRLAALQERIRVDLELGRHNEISGELRALVNAHPLDERLYGFLMLALYRSGRQAEALEVGRQARATLVAELGIEPGRELRGLELAVLNRDPALDRPAVPRPGAAHPAAETPAGPPRHLPASIADFTGRDRRLAEINRILAAGADSVAPFAVPVVGISGPGGVGKSSLAVRAAHELSVRFPDGHLYADLTAIDGADPVALFLRALGVPAAAVSAGPAERAQLYRGRLADKRLLVVLDGATGVEQVRRLLPGCPNCAVIVTSRTRLSGLCGVHWIDLELFDVSTSIELLAKIVGRQRIDAERDSAADLARLCGGLPLAVRIAGAKLAVRPHWPLARLVRRLGDRERRLDELSHQGVELRSTFAKAYHGVGDLAQRLLGRLSLVEVPDFPEWTAAALLDTSMADAEEALESLVDARLVESVATRGGQPRYHCPSLITTFARERLRDNETDADRAAALGRLLGCWLGLAESAHRTERGDNPIPHGTAPRWRPPDRRPGELVGDPVRWWEVERAGLVAAVQQAAEAGLDEMCWDLALTAVGRFAQLSYVDEWSATVRLGLAAAERAAASEGLAALLDSLGALYLETGQLSSPDRRLISR